jgi:hypothetical protein
MLRQLKCAFLAAHDTQEDAAQVSLRRLFVFAIFQVFMWFVRIRHVIQLDGCVLVRALFLSAILRLMGQLRRRRTRSEVFSTRLS